MYEQGKANIKLIKKETKKKKQRKMKQSKKQITKECMEK